MSDISIANNSRTSTVEGTELPTLGRLNTQRTGGAGQSGRCLPFNFIPFGRRAWLLFRQNRIAESVIAGSVKEDLNNTSEVDGKAAGNWPYSMSKRVRAVLCRLRIAGQNDTRIESHLAQTKKEIGETLGDLAAKIVEKHWDLMRKIVGEELRSRNSVFADVPKVENVESEPARRAITLVTALITELMGGVDLKSSEEESGPMWHMDALRLEAGILRVTEKDEAGKATLGAFGLEKRFKESLFDELDGISFLDQKAKYIEEYIKELLKRATEREFDSNGVDDTSGKNIISAIGKLDVRNMTIAEMEAVFDRLSTDLPELKVQSHFGKLPEFFRDRLRPIVKESLELIDRCLTELSQVKGRNHREGKVDLLRLARAVKELCPVLSLELTAAVNSIRNQQIDPEEIKITLADHGLLADFAEVAEVKLNGIIEKAAKDGNEMADARALFSEVFANDYSYQDGRLSAPRFTINEMHLVLDALSGLSSAVGSPTPALTLKGVREELASLARKCQENWSKADAEIDSVNDRKTSETSYCVIDEEEDL